jgi:hypothetical protein
MMPGQGYSELAARGNSRARSTTLGTGRIGSFFPNGGCEIFPSDRAGTSPEARVRQRCSRLRLERRWRAKAGRCDAEDRENRPKGCNKESVGGTRRGDSGVRSWENIGKGFLQWVRSAQVDTAQGVRASGGGEKSRVHVSGLRFGVSRLREQDPRGMVSCEAALLFGSAHASCIECLSAEAGDGE